MSRAPYMPVFVDALIGDTTHLSAAEFGAYCLILFATWNNKGQALPDDPKRMARICRVSTTRWVQHLRPALIGFFDVSDGRLHQKRLEKEWVKATVTIDQKTRAAEAKWRKEKKTEDAAASEPHIQSIPIPNKKEDTVPIGTAAEEAAPDRVKELFDEGLRVLGGATPANRALLGKLRKEYRDPKVLEAIVRCKSERPSEPAAFLIACLSHASRRENAHDAETRAFEFVSRPAAHCGHDSSLAAALLDAAGVERGEPPLDGRGLVARPQRLLG